MNEKEALILLNELVNYAAKKPITLNKDNDLRRDKILDSLSMLIFFYGIGKQNGHRHARYGCFGFRRLV